MPTCKFCSLEKNGDLPLDHDIIFGQFKMDFAHKFELHGEDHDVTCDAIVEKEADVSVYISESNNLCAYFSTDYDRDQEFYEFEAKQKINFCPVCGRDLRKGPIYRD